MASLRPHWGLCVVILLVASELPNTATKDIAEVVNDNNNGALIAVETEDEDEADPHSQKAFGKDVFDPDKETFQATHHWQTVKQGQAIPPGLHVRLNMQTGRREAKLMADNNGIESTSSSTNYISQGSPDRVQRMKDAIQQAMQEMDTTSVDKKESTSPKTAEDKEDMKMLKQKYFTHDELKNALKTFKAEQTVDRKVNTKHRNIEELKKEFAEMNAVVKSDLEILQELLEKYKQPDLSEDDLRMILADLEYYLHQIDNAQNFVTLGGFEQVMRDLNHSSDVIRSETALVLGSAIQSNPKVQVAAMEVGAMQQLVRMSSVESSNRVRSHVLYALSALVRHFPFAQLHFLQLGGLHSLKMLFSQPDTARLRLRAITLINDMLLEQKAILQHQPSNDLKQQEKLRQYQNIPLLETLRDDGWCDLVPSLLTLPEHDAREKVLHAMSTLGSLCYTSFTGVHTVLLSLRIEYEKLALTEMDKDDTYFQDMLTLVDSVMKELNIVKTEL